MGSPRPPDPEPIPLRATAVLDRDPRDLLTAGEFAAVAAIVASNNPGMTTDLAERITAEALRFLAARAQDRNAAIAPSLVVDEGWHALVLHTVLYADLCDRLGGFIHHQPELPEDGGYDAGLIDRTLTAIRSAGYEPDAALWAGPDEQLVAVGATTWHTPFPEPPIEPRPRPKPGS